jgi:hypothetical protein
VVREGPTSARITSPLGVRVESPYTRRSRQAGPLAVGPRGCLAAIQCSATTQCSGLIQPRRYLRGDVDDGSRLSNGRGAHGADRRSTTVSTNFDRLVELNDSTEPREARRTVSSRCDREPDQQDAVREGIDHLAYRDAGRRSGRAQASRAQVADVDRDAGRLRIAAGGRVPPGHLDGIEIARIRVRRRGDGSVRRHSHPYVALIEPELLRLDRIARRLATDPHPHARPTPRR